MSAAVNHDTPSEIAILARILGDDRGNLSPTVARHILKRGFTDADKARMHNLAVRNQEDALTADEKDELVAYARAGTLLSILKARARRALRGKAKKRSAS